jgi:hypothetical protein
MLGAQLSGLDVAQTIVREHAAIRVGLVTGNTEPVRLAQLRASGLPVIVKPATPERLVALFSGDTDPLQTATTAA